MTKVKQFKPMSENYAHVTRFSDASTFDEICVKCGATDACGPIDGACAYSHSEALKYTAQRVRDQ